MPDFGRWTSNGGDPSLNEINRTDRFLDALASEQPVYSTDPGEAELAYLLAGWRDEHRVPPAKALVTQRDAVAALNRGTRQRTRFSMAVLGSVAAAVLCLGGFGAVVAGAGPGDALYGLRTMLFGEQRVTRDDQVVLAAQTELAEVQQLIEQGQWDAAQDKLAAVTTTVATVDDVARKQELVDQWQELSVKVETKDANATVPPNAPPATLPPVPAIVESSATETSLTTTPTTTPSSEVSTPIPTPTPSTPLPTPTPSTPLPTPTPSTPLPTPTPSTPTADADAVDPAAYADAVDPAAHADADPGAVHSDSDPGAVHSDSDAGAVDADPHSDPAADAEFDRGRDAAADPDGHDPARDAAADALGERRERASHRYWRRRRRGR